MTPIADLAAFLSAAGLPPEQVAIAIDLAQRHAMSAMSADIPRTEIQLRRDKDRERKRKRRAEMSADIPADKHKQAVKTKVYTADTSADIPAGHISISKIKKDIRGSRMSADWTLPESYRLWALGKGLSEGEIGAQAERFKDWWLAKAGKDATKRDWFAAWRTWCGNFLERAGRFNSGGQRRVEGII